MGGRCAQVEHAVDTVVFILGHYVDLEMFSVSQISISSNFCYDTGGPRMSRFAGIAEQNYGRPPRSITTAMLADSLAELSVRIHMSSVVW